MSGKPPLVGNNNNEMERCMRLLLAALLGIAMAGCASAPGDVLETWRIFLKDTPDVELSQRQIQRFPP